MPYLGGGLGYFPTREKTGLILGYESTHAATSHLIFHLYGLKYPNMLIYNKATGSIIFPLTVEASFGKIILTFSTPQDISVTWSILGDEIAPIPIPTSAASLVFDGPSGIHITNDGLFTYVINNTGDTIAQFSRNTITGNLTPLVPATIVTGANPYYFIAAPDDSSLYTASSVDNTISQFSRNSSTGLLTFIGSIATGPTPGIGCISPEGTHLYIVNGNDFTVSQYSRNVGTGLLTPLSPATFYVSLGPYSMFISSDGLHAYIGNTSASISQYSRNVSTGILTPLSPAMVALPNGYGFLAIAPNGSSIYSTSLAIVGAISQFSRNSVTGQLSALTPSTVNIFTNNPTLIFMEPNGTHLYAVDYNNNEFITLLRNPSTSLLTVVPPNRATGAGPDQLAVSPDSAFAYVTNYDDNAITITALNL